MSHAEELILYVADQLDEPERGRFEEHLSSCAECQADLQLWRAVRQEVVGSQPTAAAPAHLAEQALDRVHHPTTPRSALRRVFQLLRSQALLVQREMWPASAAVMALGAAVAVVSRHAEFIYFITPLVAAASLSFLFRPEHDPAHELLLAAPTSAWKLLLSRLAIVSAYDLLLAFAALSVLMLAFPPGLLGTLAVGLLAPMAFLSALALLLSLWIGTGQAIAITYSLWLIQYATYQLVGTWMRSPAWTVVVHAYQVFWQRPALLLALSVPLLLLALRSANRPAHPRID